MQEGRTGVEDILRIGPYRHLGGEMTPERKVDGGPTPNWLCGLLHGRHGAIWEEWAIRPDTCHRQFELTLGVRIATVPAAAT